MNESLGAKRSSRKSNKPKRPSRSKRSSSSKKTPRKRSLRTDGTILGLVIALIVALYSYYFEDKDALVEEQPSTTLSVGTPLLEHDEALEKLRDDPSIRTPFAGGADGKARPRFLMYNVENYFIPGDRNRSPYVMRPKSEQSRRAVADVIDEAAPDIVGLIELGGRMAIQDLQTRLHERGRYYPYYRVLERKGEDRAVGILSRYPIVEDHSKAQASLYGNHRRKMLRGILDVTVQLNGRDRLRVMGVHLKSRVSDDQAKATAQRTSEAQTLALHIAEAMKHKPNQAILVFGDWNDSPHDSSLGVLEQGKSRISGLHRITAKDSRGEEWTLYYRRGKTYYVFDQIYINTPLKEKRAKGARSAVVDDPQIKHASDHRPVWIEL